MSKKNFPSKLIMTVITIVVIFLNIYTFIFLYNRKQDEQETKELITEINKNTTVTKQDKITTTPSSDTETKEELVPITIDLNKLIEMNSDTKGWLKVDSTNINYPFVQTTDNNYYLSHSFNKKSNKSGWIFLDYRNNIDNLSNNTIIYGHNRLTGTMFGTLKKLLNTTYQQNSNNYIYISTQKNSYVFKVFSTYITDNETYYLQTTFNNDKTYSNFLTTLKNHSTYNYNIELTNTDKILTLSTCSGNSNRLVVHAKLIYSEQK